MRSEEKAKKVPKICSVDLLNGHEWRKVEFRQYIFVVRTYKLDRNEGNSFLRRGQAKVLFKTGALL